MYFKIFFFWYQCIQILFCFIFLIIYVSYWPPLKIIKESPLVLGLFLVVCTKEVLGLIFWVLEAIFLCFFLLVVFSGYFQWGFGYFSVLIFWLGFYVIAVGFFSRFQVWFTKGNLMVSMRFFVMDFLGNLLGCLGVFCELFRKKMVRVGWDGEMERMKLGWDGVIEEKWERREKRLEKKTSTEEKKRN